MARQSDNIAKYKEEVKNLNAQVRAGKINPRIASERIGKLNKIILDNELVRSPRAALGQTPNTWGVNIPDDERDDLDDEDDLTEEGDTGNTGDTSEDGDSNSNEEMAKEIQSGIEANDAETGFDKNTEAGRQKAAKEEEKAKASGAPTDPTQAASEKPTGSPTPATNEPALPGGKAIQGETDNAAEAAKNSGNPAQAKKEANSNPQQTAAGSGNISDRIKQFGARAQTGIKNGIQKGKDEFKKRVSKEAMKALVKSPIFWYVVGGLLLVLLVIGIGFGVFGGLHGNGNTGNTGSTYVQAVDPVKDKDWLSKLLQYSGDAEIKEEKSKEMILTTRKALTDIQADTTLSAALRGKATTALNDLEIFESSPTASRQAAGQKVIADIKSITDEFFSCRSIYVNNPFYYVGALDSVPLKKTDLLGTENGLPAVAVNPRMCGLLIAMADPNTGVKFPTAKTPALKLGFRGTHTVFVGGDGPKDPKTSKSSHYCGNGLDINPGENTGMTDKTVGDAIRAWLFANEATLKTAKIFPEETFGPGPDYSSNIDSFVRKTAIKEGKESFGPGYVSGHEDHTHIGFGGCK